MSLPVQEGGEQEANVVDLQRWPHQRCNYQTLAAQATWQGPCSIEALYFNANLQAIFPLRYAGAPYVKRITATLFA